MNAPPSFAAPKRGALVLVRFGGVGAQIAFVDDVAGGLYKVRKFRAVSGRWTKPARVPLHAIVGVPEVNDARAKKAREHMKAGEPCEK